MVRYYRVADLPADVVEWLGPCEQPEETPSEPSLASRAAPEEASATHEQRPAPSPDSVGADAIAEALGCAIRTVQTRARRESWPFEEQPVRGGQKRYYRVDELPEDVRGAVVDPGAKSRSTRRASIRLEQASQKQRDEALQRRSQLRAFEEFHEKRGDEFDNVKSSMRAFLQARQLTDPDAPALRTLERWRSAYRKGGVAGLIPRRDRCGRKPVEWPKQAKAFLQAVWRNPPASSKQAAIRRLREEARREGWRLPSDDTLARYVDQLESERRRRSSPGTTARQQEAHE